MIPFDGFLLRFPPGIPIPTGSQGLPFNVSFDYSIYTLSYVLLKVWERSLTESGSVAHASCCTPPTYSHPLTPLHTFAPQGYGEVGTATTLTPRGGEGGGQLLAAQAFKQGASAGMTAASSSQQQQQQQQQQQRRRRRRGRSLLQSGGGGGGSGGSRSHSSVRRRRVLLRAASASTAPLNPSSLGRQSLESGSLLRLPPLSLDKCPYSATPLPVTRDAIALEPHMASGGSHKQMISSSS